MRDPIDELSHFDPGPTMNPLPAAEVRRRGTRLRRRNTALTAIAVAAAVTVVAVPVAALSGHGSSSAPEPAPQPRTLVTEIPSSVDLTAVPTGSSVTFQASDGAVVDDFHLCGPTSFSSEDGATDVAGATYGEPGTESSDTRTLFVFPDDQTATREVAQLRASVASCPEDTVGKVDYVWGTVDAAVPADESLVLSSQVRLDPTLLSDLTLLEVARVGNAVLVATTHTSAGGDQAIEETTPVLTQLSQPVLDQMCVFSAAGCGTTSDAVDPTPSGAAVTAIPADFPLLDGLPTTEATKDFGRYGPGQDDDLLSVPGCGDDTLPTPEPASRLRGGWRDPAEARDRQLVVFSSVAEAASYLDAFTSLAGCTTEHLGDGVTRIHSGAGSDLGLGDQAQINIVWHRVDGRPAPGFEITEMVRVGNAVLVQDRIVDGSNDEVTSAYLEQIITESDQSLARVVDAMDVYAT